MCQRFDNTRNFRFLPGKKLQMITWKSIVTRRVKKHFEFVRTKYHTILIKISEISMTEFPYRNFIFVIQ
jgi:hypothetical protein